MRRRRPTILACVSASLLAITPAAMSQTVQYAYDAAGRLSVVADARGDLAVYDYDAVGNLTSIRRLTVADAPDAVVIALIVPGAARRGSRISIFGKGFATTTAGNIVAVNGAPARVVTATPTRLTVEIPRDATTGAVQLTTPLGMAASVQPLRVLDALAITPASAVVAPGGSVRFTPLGESAGAVRWSVDGRAGGDARRGTITSDGVYAAPASSRGGTVRVTATSLVDAALEATALVSMMAPRSVFIVAEPSVSVEVATATTFSLAAPVVVRVAPLVTNVSPSSGGRGEMVRVVVTGAGFGEATGLEFMAGATADPALAVRTFTLSADGREATADVDIASDAGVGPRIVRVVTPTDSSGAAALGHSVFIVR
jgi:hypothetical protein